MKHNKNYFKKKNLAKEPLVYVKEPIYQPYWIRVDNELKL